MLAATDWGPILFATLVPLGFGIIGGLIHVVFRLGKLTQDVQTLKDGQQFLMQRLFPMSSRKFRQQQQGETDDK